MTTKIALTKALSTERDAITAKASAAHEALTAALDVYNGAVADAYAELKAARDAYNDTLAEVRELCEGVGSDLRGAFDERSEKWQESDKGSECDAFVRAWEDFSAEDFDIDEPDEVEGPEDVAEAMNEQLADEPA